MGLIFTKTFIKNNNFNVKIICGLQDIIEITIPETLECKEEEEEEEEEEEYDEDYDVEGEIIEKFEEDEYIDAENIDEEEFEDPFEFKTSPLDLKLRFTNPEKKD